NPCEPQPCNILDQPNGRFMSDRRDHLVPEHAHVVMRLMPVAVTRCSADLRYLWVSQRYADWIGCSPEGLIGRPIVEVLGEEELRTIRTYVESVLKGKTVEYEASIVFKNLGTRWIHAEYTPTFDARGAPDGWVAAVTDITDRKRAEQQLAANNA